MSLYATSSFDAERPQVKGTVLRSLVWALETHGLVDAVALRVSPASRAILEDPPLPTAWIDIDRSLEIHDATLQIAGPARLRRISRDATSHGVAPLLRGAIERLIAIFGASPHAIFSRIDRIAGTTSRGTVYDYAATGACSGVFEMGYPTLTNMSLGVFAAAAGSLELGFDLCHVRGAFGDPEMVQNKRNNRAQFAVAWQP